MGACSSVVMRRGALFLLVASCISSASANEEGPFGVEMGTPAATYHYCRPAANPGWYECTQLRHGHPSFSRYEIEASPNTGVCSVLAIGNTIENDRYGVALKQEAASIARQIAEQYGLYDRINDELSSGSIWSDPQDWMIGLKKNERTFAYLWNDDGSRPNHVSSISVVAFGASEDSGFIAVHFNFRNKDTCRQKVTADLARAFGKPSRPSKRVVPKYSFERVAHSAIADFLSTYQNGGTTGVRIKMSRCYTKTTNARLPYCLAFDAAAESILPGIESQSNFPPTEEYKREVFDKRVRINLAKHGISAYDEQTQIISDLSLSVSNNMLGLHAH